MKEDTGQWGWAFGRIHEGYAAPDPVFLGLLRSANPLQVLSVFPVWRSCRIAPYPDIDDFRLRAGTGLIRN